MGHAYHTPWTMPRLMPGFGGFFRNSSGQALEEGTVVSFALYAGTDLGSTMAAWAVTRGDGGAIQNVNRQIGVLARAAPIDSGVPADLREVVMWGPVAKCLVSGVVAVGDCLRLSSTWPGVAVAFVPAGTASQCFARALDAHTGSTGPIPAFVGLRR